MKLRPQAFFFLRHRMMPAKIAALRYPHERVLLPRTKLAYVHLRNLLTDAKRDRSGRVFGYVGIWMPEEFILLYLQEGEVVNATTSDGRHHAPLAIADALERVPHEPEFGEICFHEADDEQLACMFYSQTAPPEPWPEELNPSHPSTLFPYLISTTWDGVVEVVAGGAVHYLILRDGVVQRAFLADGQSGAIGERVTRIFASGNGREAVLVRRWPVPPPLPVQAPPALVQAYRELTTSLIRRLVEHGRESAPAIAEHARRTLLPRHPVLDAFTISDRVADEPVADTATLTAGVAAWLTDLMWAAGDLYSLTPEQLLRELTWERRHMFQSAGLFDAMPFPVEW